MDERLDLTGATSLELRVSSLVLMQNHYKGSFILLLSVRMKNGGAISC
jgi:hypothetical protein